MAVINPFYPTVISHPRYRYFKDAPNWNPVTAIHTYQDNRKSFNELSDTPEQIWELTYQFNKHFEGHWEKLAILEAHFWERRISRPFTFLEKDGNVVPGCYYKTFEPSHEGHISWFQERRIVIVCDSYTGVLLSEPLYLVDDAGNFYTDESGNFYVTNNA